MNKFVKFWKWNWPILLLIFLLCSIITGIVCLVNFTTPSERPKKIADNVSYFVKKNCDDNYASLHNDDVVRCQNYKRNELLKKRNGLLEKINSKIDWYENEIKNYKIQLSLIKKPNHQKANYIK